MQCMQIISFHAFHFPLDFILKVFENLEIYTAFELTLEILELLFLHTSRQSYTQKQNLYNIKNPTHNKNSNLVQGRE